MKIPGYKIHKINYIETLSDGSAIAIKCNIHHNLYNDFETDFLAVEIETSLGSIIVTRYLSTTKNSFLLYTDMHHLLSNIIPTYIMSDVNGRHNAFGNKDKNTMGKSLINLIDQGKMIHIGPCFLTYHSHNAPTNPDQVFSNRHHYLNCICEPGEITTSDHLPIILKLTTIPFITEKPMVYKTSKVNWDLFQEKIDSEIKMGITLNN